MMNAMELKITQKPRNHMNIHATHLSDNRYTIPRKIGVFLQVIFERFHLTGADMKPLYMPNWFVVITYIQRFIGVAVHSPWGKVLHFA
jgi:hypothetical protein